MAHVYRNEPERDAIGWMPKSPHHLAAAITPNDFPLTKLTRPSTQVVVAEPYPAAGYRPEWLLPWQPRSHDVPCLHVLPEVIAEMTSTREHAIIQKNKDLDRLATGALQAKGMSMSVPNMQRLCEAAQAIQTLLNHHMAQNHATVDPLIEVIAQALTQMQDAFNFAAAQVWLAPAQQRPRMSERMIRSNNTHVSDTVATALNALARQAYREQRWCQHRITDAGVTILAMPLRHDQAMYGALAIAHNRQQPLRDEEMAMAELVVTQITGALVSEEQCLAAHASEHFWNTVADSQPDGFILYDKQHNVIKYSQAALDLATNRAEVIAARAAGQSITPIWKTRWSNEAEVTTTDAPSRLAIMTGTPTKAAQIWVCPDPAKSKTKILVLVSASPIIDNDATIQGAVVRFQDITSMKAVETLKLRLVKHIQHDIRSPLTLLLVRSQQLRMYADRLTPEKLRDYVTGMEAAITTISAKLNNLADLDNAIWDPPVHMSLVDHVWSYLHDQRQHYGVRRIQCQIEAVDSELEGYWSPREIDSVIDNLIQNAIKYSPEDSPILVRLYPIKRDDKQMAHMEVVDHGYGVPAEDKARIFENEYRSVKQTPDGRDIPGTGMGLNFCYAAVRMHEGKIWVESPGLGHGSTFHVELPLEK